jgi:hypothetical protein
VDFSHHVSSEPIKDHKLLQSILDDSFSLITHYALGVVTIIITSAFRHSNLICQMSQTPRKSYRRVVPKSATVRIYTEEEQKLMGGVKPKPLIPDNKSFVSSRISKGTTNTKSTLHDDKDSKSRDTSRLVTKTEPKNPGLSPLPKSEELKGYMRPKSTRPGSSKQRDSVTSRPSTSSRPNSARPPSKEKKKKHVFLFD